MEARKRKGKWVELVSRGLEGEHKVAFTVNVSVKLQTAEQPSSGQVVAAECDTAANRAHVVSSRRRQAAVW